MINGDKRSGIEPDGEITVFRTTSGRWRQKSAM